MSKPIQTVEELDAVLHWRGRHAQAIRERDALQQLLNQRDEQVESLKMRPQVEPVARHPDAIIEGVMTSVGITHAIYASTVSLKHGEQVKLYAEQPAPVAVALPERVDPRYFDNVKETGIGWNACLDEVTRLNAKR